MNVIVSNKYQAMLETLEIDVIKNVNGEFLVDEIIKEFQNFYFQRMILDVTAIKDYKNIKNIQKLSISLDMSKVILLLDDSAESASSEYLSNLISMGIYNFTKNTEGILYLYKNPNSYRDVAHIQQLEVEKPPVAVATSTNTQSVNNSYNEVRPVARTRVIGLKSVNKEAGATTLAYMLKQELDNNYSVAAIEVDKRDFMFFRGKNLISTTTAELSNTINKNGNNEVIIIDVNGSRAAENLCDTVLYLMEPSIIKINKMMMVSSKALSDLENKKVVLNRSLLSSNDVDDFEYESKLKIFFNMPPINDRNKNDANLNKLLNKLGFDRQQIIE